MDIYWNLWKWLISWNECKNACRVSSCGTLFLFLLLLNRLVLSYEWLTIHFSINLNTYSMKTIGKKLRCNNNRNNAYIEMFACHFTQWPITRRLTFHTTTADAMVSIIPHWKYISIAKNVLSKFFFYQSVAKFFFLFFFKLRQVIIVQIKFAQVIFVHSLVGIILIIRKHWIIERFNMNSVDKWISWVF